MDLYPPSELSRMNPKQLSEAIFDMEEEHAALTATRNRSSVQELGLQNIAASLVIAKQKWDENWASSSGRRYNLDPNEVPGSGPAKQRQQESEKYMTLTGADGQVAYYVQPGQKIADLPGHRPAGESNAIGQIVRAVLTSDYSGLGPEARAAIDNSNGTSVMLPQHLSSDIIDLARAQSPLGAAGMGIIALTGDNLKIPRVLADPAFSVKIKNDSFVEDESMQFGAVNIIPKTIGVLLRVAMEDLDDVAGFSDLISTEITKAFAQSIDHYGLNGSAGAQEPTGIFSFSDIANTDVATAALGWLSLSAAALAIKNRNHMPSSAIMTPTREYQLLESVDEYGQWLEAPPTLRNTQMLSSTQVPADNFMIGDFSKFVLGLRTGLRIDFTDVGGGAFEKNQRLFRVYWRGNFAVLNEHAFQKITVTA